MSEQDEASIELDTINGQEGFYLRDPSGKKLGELTFQRLDDHRASFDHTWVDGSQRGKGRARQLLDAGLAWARANDMKVVPVCSYVVKQFEKDESIRDMLAD